MGKLTVVGIKALVAPGRYGDGDGLHLHVRGPDRRAWVLRYTRQGKTRDLGLGAFPDVSLADARRAAGEALGELRAGREPQGVRQVAKAAQPVPSVPTFREVAEAHVAAHRDGWRNPKHAAQWASTLAAYAFPVLGPMPVSDVDVAAVLKVLQPLWTRAPETATRLRGRIEAVLDAAKVRGWRTGENPARWKGNLSGLLPARGRVARVEHQPSLPWQRVGAFLAELRTVPGASARALELAILTAARTGEVRGATWDELDLVEAVWTVPADRMKAGRLHRVPLSAPALALLRRLAELRTADPLVFPGGRAGRPLSDMALSVLIRRMNARGEAPRWVDAPAARWCHTGSAARSASGRASARRQPREVIEAALAHVLRDKVEAAYARTDLLERRRPLMEAWGTWCEGKAGEVVVPIAGGRRVVEE